MTEPPPDRPFPANAEIRRDRVRNTIRLLKADDLSAALEEDPAFRDLQAEGRFDAIALSFIDAHRSAFGLEKPLEELSPRTVKSDQLGLTHVKLQQQFEGLPIWAAECVVHLNQQNQVYLVNGRYVRTPRGLDTTPSLVPADARRAASEALLEPEDFCQACPVELGIFADEDGSARLAHRVIASVGLIKGWQFTLDAHDGTVLQKLPTAINVSPGGSAASPRR